MNSMDKFIRSRSLASHGSHLCELEQPLPAVSANQSRSPRELRRANTYRSTSDIKLKFLFNF